jgi:phosphoserine aminotransferase
MNLFENQRITADYVESGYWSCCAREEASRYCKLNVVKSLEERRGIISVTPMEKWSLSEDSLYLHYCENETINGIWINEEPAFKNKIVIADFSSCILSCPISIEKYGLIYASAQKNIGPSGLTIVIVHEDLIGNARKELPSTLNY